MLRLHDGELLRALRGAEVDLHGGDVPEVGAALQHVGPVGPHRLHVVVMVVAGENHVDLGHRVGQELIVGHAHVRQGDDDLSALEGLEVLREPPAALAEVLVLDIVGVQCGQGHQPLVLDEANEADLAAVVVDHSREAALGKRPPGLLLRDIADQPWEVGLRSHFHELVDAEIKVVVAIARRVDAHEVQPRDHVLPHRDRRSERWVEGVTAKKYQGLLLAPGQCLLLQLVHPRDEARQAAHGLLLAGLDVVDVVEVEDGHALGRGPLLGLPGGSLGVLGDGTEPRRRLARRVHGVERPSGQGLLRILLLPLEEADGGVAEGGAVDVEGALEERGGPVVAGDLIRPWPAVEVGVLDPLLEHLGRHTAGHEEPREGILRELGGGPEHSLPQGLQRAGGSVHAVVQHVRLLAQLQGGPLLVHLRPDGVGRGLGGIRRADDFAAEPPPRQRLGVELHDEERDAVAAGEEGVPPMRHEAVQQVARAAGGLAEPALGADVADLEVRRQFRDGRLAPVVEDLGGAEAEARHGARRAVDLPLRHGGCPRDAGGLLEQGLRSCGQIHRGRVAFRPGDEAVVLLREHAGAIDVSVVDLTLADDGDVARCEVGLQETDAFRGAGVGLDVDDRPVPDVSIELIVHYLLHTAPHVVRRLLGVDLPE
mmetsp:Transcript_47718/g.139073  ORF Transcript_47718/g.139073 Transcript_47718/m.139073 type:complete len:653 (+) Transcript_47718:999-2957(+)